MHCNFAVVISTTAIWPRRLGQPQKFIQKSIFDQGFAVLPGMCTYVSILESGMAEQGAYFYFGEIKQGTWHGKK